MRSRFSNFAVVTQVRLRRVVALRQKGAREMLSGPFFASITLFAEQNFAAPGDVELLQRHRMEIGFHAVTFGRGAVDFVAAAIGLGLADLPAFFDQLGLERILRFPAGRGTGLTLDRAGGGGPAAGPCRPRRGR